MKIRQAKKTDDFEKIGQLLYLTDPYIYPYWFDGDINVGSKELAKLCMVKNNVYFYKHIAVAEIDGQIVGAICYFDDKADLSYDYQKEKDKNPNCALVVKDYLQGLKKEQESNVVNISNVCVFEKFRLHGVATKLLKYVIKKYNDNKTIFQIEVVAANTPALTLYTELGFEKIKEYFGFCPTEKLKCFLIRKFPDAQRP